MLSHIQSEEDIMKNHRDLTEELKAMYVEKTRKKFHNKLTKTVTKMNNTAKTIVKHRKEIEEVYNKQQQANELIQQQMNNVIKQHEEKNAMLKSEIEQQKRESEVAKKELKDDLEKQKKDNQENKHSIKQLKERLENHNKDYINQKLTYATETNNLLEKELTLQKEIQKQQENAIKKMEEQLNSSEKYIRNLQTEVTDLENKKSDKCLIS